MFVVLDISYGLIQIAVRTDTRSSETVLDLAQILIEHRDPILTDNNTLQLGWLHLLVPFMPSDILDCEPLARISVQYLSYQILTWLRNEWWYHVVTV